MCHPRQSDRPHPGITRPPFGRASPGLDEAIGRGGPFGGASPEAGRVAYGDIAILTRNNVQVEQMTRWLLEDGIRVSSERTSDITRNRIVQEVVAF